MKAVVRTRAVYLVAIFVSALGLAQDRYFAKYVGKYINIDYGFSVDIPSGMEGLGALPPAPNHGFQIPLGRYADLWVGASYEMPDSPHEFSRFNARLGRLKAELRTWKDVYFHEAIAARGFDRGTPIIYTIQLDCDASERTEQEPVFRAVVRSFRTFPVKP